MFFPLTPTNTKKGKGFEFLFFFITKKSRGKGRLQGEDSFSWSGQSGQMSASLAMQEWHWDCDLCSRGGGKRELRKGKVKIFSRSGQSLFLYGVWYFNFLLPIATNPWLTFHFHALQQLLLPLLHWLLRCRKEKKRKLVRRGAVRNSETNERK